MIGNKVSQFSERLQVAHLFLALMYYIPNKFTVFVSTQLYNVLELFNNNPTRKIEINDIRT